MFGPIKASGGKQ
jgi:hypothetical protein